MAVADYDEWRLAANSRIFQGSKGAPTAPTNTGGPNSYWLNNPRAGAAPSTAAVPDNTTTGALGQEDPDSGKSWWIREWSGFQSNQETGFICIADRLSHQGGLSGTVTTEQTTNLPTAALTRYTSGDYVQIGIEIYTSVGSTGTTISANYTNQAGTAARTTPLAVFGGAGFNGDRRFFWLPLAVGDYGVRSVEGVTLTASTGTAGNFGVTLFKPLLWVPAVRMGSIPRVFDPLLALGSVPEVVTDACLWAICPSNGNAETLHNTLKLLEA